MTLEKLDYSLLFATVQDGLAVWVIMMMQAMSQRQPSAFATA
jgi:hypothetical protein